MPTYVDVTRTSEQECIFSLNGIKERIWNPNKVIPPGTYIHSTGYDFTIGDHFGNFARIKHKIVVTSTGAFIPYTWSVYVYATVEVYNGHSGATTVTSDVLLQSQTGIADTVDYWDCDTQFDGTFEFSVDSEIKYDVTESASPTVLDLPLYTKYKQYERSKTGATALCKVVLNGTTVQQSSTVSTSQTTTYVFRVDVTQFNKAGSLAGQSQLLVQTMTTNAIAVPDYSHNNTANANYYCLHDGATVDCKNIGTDNAFGDPVTTSLTLESRVKLETPIKSIGQINAFNVSYPSSLTVKITGFDNTSPTGTTGSRTITPTGSWEENDTWKFYDIESVVGGTTVSTGPYDNSADKIQTEIISSSLSANGEDTQYTRLPMRGWQFPGASILLDNEIQITAGGTSNTRNFSPTENFNSYRYLEIEIKSNDGNLQTDTLTLTCQPGNDTKSWPIDVSSTSYVRYRIDLCTPNNKTTPTVATQDTPYPRKHPTDNTYASQEVQNDSWYGVTRVSQLSIANSSITLGNIYLVADPESATANICFPPTYYTKVQNDSNTGTTYLGRRLWQSQVSGRDEEEYDVLSTSGTKSIATIADLVSRINANHPGWTASASTASGSGLASYVNSTSGLSCWLGGITWKASGGGGTNKQTWFDVVQMSGGDGVDVIAQTIFDEFDTTELVPDYIDPFDVWGSTTPLITIPSYSVLRGRATGLLITSSWTPADGEVVNLLLSSDNSNRGNGTAAANGWYNTGSPRALSNKNHKIDYVPASLTSNIHPMLAAKQYRRTFVVGDLADNPSADKSPFYENWYAKLNGGKIDMYFATDPNGTGWTKYTTNISGVKRFIMRFIHNNGLLGIIFVCEMKAGGIKRYYSTDYGATSVATTISSTGKNPTVCVDAIGKEYYFFIDGSDIKRVILDASGTTIQSSGIVVTGNVADSTIDCYERLDDIYLVYKHTSSGITVVRSTDGGVTFS